MKLEFSRQIFEKYSMSNLIKIRAVIGKLFRAGGQTDRQTDRQTDVTKLTVAFRKFCEGA
jgi:hypothetical protein